jgi:ketosteroid isomerase-like protein
MSNSVETMVKYYDAVSNADLQTICECFDIPSKIISLYGVVNITSKEDIIKTYSDIIETWKTQDISNKIGYDKNTFDVTKIQENIDLVKTRLTNFDLDGNFLLEWDCSYIVRKEEDRWLISVGTTNNKTSKSMK